MKRTINQHRFLKTVFLLILSICSFRAVAQRDSMVLPPGYYTPQGYFDTVFDRFGNKQSLGQIAINDAVRKSVSGGAFAPVHIYTLCTPGYFQIYLEDGCGMELYASGGAIGALHTARLNVLCQVLTDISNFIPSPCTTTGQKVNILVKAGLTAGLGKGTGYYNIPYAILKQGIVDNTAWLTINSGIDAFTDIFPPLSSFAGGSSGSAFFHGGIAFNFSSSLSPLTWHTDLSTSPVINEVDLYTTALHEILHALGFISLINYDGSSVFGPGYQYYSRYDTHLKDSSLADYLIKNSGGCSLYQYTFNTATGFTPASNVLSPGGTGTGSGCTSGFFATGEADNTLLAHAIWYENGGWSSPIPVYTPECFEPGGSLSHFEDQLYVPSYFSSMFTGASTNNEYFLMSNSAPNPFTSGYNATSNPGAMKRYPTPEERQVLCDIGYKVETSFGIYGSPFASYPYPAGTNLNYYNSYGPECPGLQVVGINDGISSGGIYTYLSSGGSAVTITTASLLSNDYGVSGGSVSCMDIVIGTGALASVTGGYTYMPGSGEYGVVLLRYLPVSSSGKIGNITYVYVYIGDASCTPTACDLVLNGGFEATPNAHCGMLAYSPHPRAYCWDACSGLPTLYSRSCDISTGTAGDNNIPTHNSAPTPSGVHLLSSPLGNDHFCNLFTKNDGGGVYEINSMESLLTTGLVNGNSYTLSCWAKTCDHYSSFGPYPGARNWASHLQFGVSSGPLAMAGSGITALPSSINIIATFLVPAATPTATDTAADWYYFTQTFTYSGVTGSANNLIVLQNAMIDGYDPGISTLIYIDDISIQPSTLAGTFILPSPLSKCSAVIDLNTTVSVLGGVFTWLTFTGTDTVTIHSNIFDPFLAYQASIFSGGTGLVTVSYTYTDGFGCTHTLYAQTLIVNTITGPGSVCVGSTIALSDTVSGGIWSSSNTGVATVGSSSGIVTGVSTGTTTITYTLSTGCYFTATITVNPLPAIITGTLSLCAGSTTLLHDASPGGTWSSSATGIATIGSSGTVTGISGGTAIITYTIGSGCYVTATVTVNPLPTISGILSVCIGSTSTLGGTPTGGLWSSSATGIATIGLSSGIVTGVSSGTAIITYALGTGCSITTIVTVNPLPLAITGLLTVCAGSTTPLSDPTTGGTWSSGNIGVAIIGSSSGIVTGVSGGTATITYILSTGCYTTATVTVNPLPSISGILSVCVGSTSALGGTPAGGVWSSSTTGVATIGSSSGIVTGVSGGTATITYTLGTGCYTTATATVNPLPSISGIQSVCVGSTSTLGGTPAGGVWSSSTTGIATIGSSSGVVTGVSGGTATITYSLSTGCYITTTVTVNNLPTAIAGTAEICVGSTTSLSSTPGGGTWTSGTTTVATIDPSSGVVTGITSGTTVITYTLGTGCSVTTIVTVDDLPTTITGTAEICAGSTTTLSSTPGGGTWSSGTIIVATIDPSTGIVTGITSGTTEITYTLSTGCSVTTIVTVDDLPTAITGMAEICAGSTTTLNSTPVGGTWTSGTTTVATIDPSTGVVTALTSGTTEITYALGSGCSATITVTVDDLPAAITGTAEICAGSTTTLSSTPTGGTWTSGTTTVATIDPSTGIATGITSGTTEITYALGTGCSVTTIVTVDDLPTAITGTAEICAGSTTSLSSTPTGGTWASGATTVATIDPSTGIVTGITSGTTVITYALGTGCSVTTIVTVDDLPTTITGTTEICASSITSLNSTPAGGTWTSVTTTVATIDPSTGILTGILTGISSGTTVITYALGTGCSVTTIVTVDDLPTAITGTAEICVGSTTSLNSTPASGAWTSGTTSVATIDPSTGIVTGITSGTTEITYTLPTGCSVTTIVTVDDLPTAITGTAEICASSTTSLNSTPSGGTWSSGTTTVATIDPSTGIVTGITSGTTEITYALGTGCSVTTIVTVDDLPSAITGMVEICAGSTTSLNSTPAGGTWTSGTAAVATIDPSSGVVTGVTSGTTEITYTLGTGCSVTIILTVDDLPTVVTGTAEICAGSTTTLSSTPGGGTWSSGTITVATIDPSTGIVTGITSGTTEITYTLSTGCSVTTIVTVDDLPTAITGMAEICVGSTTTLNSTPVGGTWTSGTTTVATIDPSTGVVTALTSGTTEITYALGSGCSATITITVDDLPAAITGTAEICAGSTTTLSSTPTGGTWASGTTTVATIDPSTGIVTGIISGTTEITYTIGAGCSVTTIVTVDDLPTTITGSMEICAGSTTSLNSTPAGGTWTSGTTTVATIDPSTGILTGIISGTTEITYTLSTGCSVTAIVTVDDLPTAITGIRKICVDATTTLNSTPAGGVWTSGTPAIATIDPSTGVATGITAGIATITYTLGTGCYVATIISVAPAPDPIAGILDVCVGSTTALSDPTGGGTWSSGTPAVATIDPTSGIANGISPGTTVITYTSQSGCYVTAVLTVDAMPVISGTYTLCIGGATTLSVSPTSGGTWTSDNTGIATVDPVTGVVTGVAGGTVTITYTTPGGGCFATVIITVIDQPVCVCGTGTTFVELDPTHSGFVPSTASLPAGIYYYLNHPITISGNVNMINKVIVIAPGVTITVAPNFTLTLNHCHLFCCPGNMWRGIYLAATTGTASGHLTIINYSLIEDAKVAVEIPKPFTPAGGYILRCDGATFNKNNIGIFVHDYLDVVTPSATLTTLLPCYRFLIRNTVFTSRDLYPYTTAATAGAVTPTNSWPFAWPNADGPGVGALKKAWVSGSTYLPPYNIDKPVPYPLAPAGGYAVVPCNNGTPAQIGIMLRDVGFTNTTAGFGSEVYSSFVEGSGLPAGTAYDKVMFDHLMWGMYALNSNFIARNSIYQHIGGNATAAAGGGVGIFAKHTTDALHLTNLYGMNVLGQNPTPTGYGNKFYDCNIGVGASEMYYVKSESNFMISTQNIAVPGATGKLGYQIITSHYYDIQINKNYLFNLNTGVNFVATIPPPGLFGLHGEVSVQSNNIRPDFGTGIPAGTFVQQGISVQNLASCGKIYPGSEVNLDNNHLNKVFNGIYAANFPCQGQPVTANTNQINIVDASATVYAGIQAGIKAVNINPCYVVNNNITGPGFATPTPPSASGADYATATTLIEGIHVGSLVRSYVSCNHVSNTNTGYFFGSTNSLQWLSNEMNNNAYGYVLDGIIGEQGYSLTEVCNNTWTATGAFSWTSGTNYQTYVMNGNTSTTSQLDVDGTNDPINNWGDVPPVLPTDVYACGIIGSGTGCGLNVTTGSIPTCPFTPPPTTVAYKPVFVKAATKQLDYTINIPKKDWIGQYNVWKALNADTTTGDTTAVLSSFKLMGTYSRYSHLKDIEDNIVSGDFTSAQTKLSYDVGYMASTDSDVVTGAVMADDSESDNIVTNYKQYYGLMLKFAQDTLNADDSLQVKVLANKCPFVDGTVVYQARTLFCHIFNDNSIFNDMGCEFGEHTIGERKSNRGDSASIRKGLSSIIASNQRYTLSPNPSDGNIILKQQIADSRTVIADVLNAAGVSVFKNQVHFEEGVYKLQLNNLTPGLYLMQLVDSGGEVFALKFVVNK